MHGSMLSRPGRVSRALVHVTDWLPTLVTAAGGDIREMMEGDTDGVEGDNGEMMEGTSGR